MLQAAVTPVKLLLRRITFVSSACIVLACGVSPQPLKVAGQLHPAPAPCPPAYINKHNVIHVLVALCDNLHQGIEPVPKSIGNGQDPATNLYWGCDYGVKTFLQMHTTWQLVATIKNAGPRILERCIFKQAACNAYLVADAYDGAYIKNTMADFCNACAGAANATVVCNSDTLGILGNANLIAYIGHEGLMDVSLDSVPPRRDNRKRGAIILACESKQYWGGILYKTGANPVLLTTELMCPEAYTLHAAVTGWLNNENALQIHQRASAAYSKYQHCPLKAAQQLLATGY